MPVLAISPQFAPEHNLLLVSSWSSEVRMYDVLVNARRATYSHKAAVLDTCWGNEISLPLHTTMRPYDILL